MINKQRILMAGVPLIVIVSVSACSLSSSHRASSVSGLRDDVRHLAQRTQIALRPHMVRTCTTATKQVKHTSKQGKRRTSRTWYETTPITTCRRIQNGTETYTRVTRRERWCVELDQVNGDRHRRDVWFQVTSGTYLKALGTKEGTKIKFVPVGYGC